MAGDMKRTSFAAILLSLSMQATAVAAGSAVEKIDLFIANEEGYKLYRIPGIVVTKRGTVLTYCEARKSDSGDWGPIDVLMRRSTDGGRTWAPRRMLVKVEGDLPINPVAAAQKLDRPGDNTVNNPVAIVDQETGAVHFLYCLEYMRCFYERGSTDGANIYRTGRLTVARIDEGWVRGAGAKPEGSAHAKERRSRQPGTDFRASGSMAIGGLLPRVGEFFPAVLSSHVMRPIRPIGTLEISMPVCWQRRRP